MTQAYDKVRAYLASRSDLVRGSGATEDEVGELVTAWGPLPDDFATYLREYGWVRFGAQELLGLGKGVEPHQDLLKQARRLWKGDGECRLPEDLLPIYDSGGGWVYCISRLDPAQPVVCWADEYAQQGGEQPYDETYATWSEWFLLHLTEAGAESTE
jgi:hypothetical protein